MFPAPSTSTESDLLNNMLDRGYANATAQTARAILNGSVGGAMGQRLREFEAEAKRLQNAGLPLTTDNPVYQAMMYQFQQTLNTDAQRVNNAAGGVQESGVDAGLTISKQMTLSAAGLYPGSTYDVAWRRPDPEAINAVVGYVNSGSWANELGDYTTDTLNEVNLMVIRGIVEGRNAGSIARDLRDMIGTLPLYKANNLLRTLQLQSYRDATSLNYIANSDIISGQIRIAALDGRTCLCCVALHGTELAVGERVDDHHAGRCTSIAKLAGFNYNIQSGSDWYNSLSNEAQIELAGYANWNALKSGAVTLSQYVQPYTDPVFGSMLRESSLKGILGNTASDYYKPRGGNGGGNPTVQTVNGVLPRDIGHPGSTPESLHNFIANSNGPLAETFKDFELGVVYQDFNTDKWVVDPDNTKIAAKNFVAESQNIQYGKDYLVSLVQQQAAQNGVNVDMKGAEQLYNDAYKNRAIAIQTAANVGGVKLTEAQFRRLEIATQGQYLNMVYTTQSSLAGSLANQTKREVKYGGNSYATDAARREARRNLLRAMGQLDES